VAQEPGPIVEVTSHTNYRHTHIHTRQDSSVRVISLSQMPLHTQHTTNTEDEHPYTQRDSNARSQQPSGCRIAPDRTDTETSQEIVLTIKK